jgi:hypothetical protein
MACDATVLAGEPILRGGERYIDLVVGIGEADRPAALVHADDLERHVLERHPRTEHRLGRRSEHRRHLAAEHGDSPAVRVVGERKEPTPCEAQTVDPCVIGRRADDLQVEIAVAELHLLATLLFGHDGGDLPCVVGERGRVLRRE